MGSISAAVSGFLINVGNVLPPVAETNLSFVKQKDIWQMSLFTIGLRDDPAHTLG